MLDIKEIRKNPDLFIANLALRSDKYTNDINTLLELDKKKRIELTAIEDYQAQRNTLSKSIKSPEQAQTVKAQVQEINSSIKSLEQSINELTLQIDEILHGIPNILDNTVPVGKSEDNNQVMHTWGDIPVIDKARPHEEIANNLGLFDQEYTANIAGTRFTTFTGQGAQLVRALKNYFLDKAVASGYQEMSPPHIVNNDALFGTGQLPKFHEDVYKLEGESKYLIPTAEVPLTGLYATKNLKESDLNIKLAAYTPCYRSEAGSAGRDTKGIIRQHQFDKVELVHIAKPEESHAEHESLVRHAEILLEELNLPYRRVLLCSGDTGFSASKCYDLEVWFPSQNAYREISSCSNCLDFQARRLKFKYKDSNKKNQFVHTLNGSGLAIGRAWAAILENYQVFNNNNIEVNIPAVLQPYMNNLTVITPK